MRPKLRKVPMHVTLLRSGIPCAGKAGVWDENHRFASLRGDFLSDTRFAREFLLGLRCDWKLLAFSPERLPFALRCE